MRDPQDRLGVLRSGGARPPTYLIVDYINVHKVRFGVEQIGRVLTEHGIAVSPSTYYARSAAPSTETELADAYAAHEVFCFFHDQRGLYGVLKLWHCLRRRGRDVGRDQVARLMGICGIAGIVRGKRRTVTTESDPAAAQPRPDRPPVDAPTRPDHWWVADFTYVWTLAGFCYVSFVVDVHSRRILGWRASMTRRAGPVGARASDPHPVTGLVRVHLHRSRPAQRCRHPG